MSPSDFTSISLNILNFTANDPKILTISVPVKEDTSEQLIETFFVNLLNCISCVISDSQGIGIILDDGKEGGSNGLVSD